MDSNPLIQSDRQRAQILERFTELQADIADALADKTVRQFADLPSDQLARQAETLYRQRRHRDDYFGEDLFGEPGWDILLDLYVQQAHGRQVSVSSVCIAASVPGTTALRYIEALAEQGWLTRQDDPTDRRRRFVCLSRKGLEAMHSYLGEMVARSGSGVLG